MLGNFACFFGICGFSFKMNFFKKIFQEYHQCQTIWIQIRPDVLSGLIRVQTVCKGYQQTTKVPTSWEKVNKKKNCWCFSYFFIFICCGYSIETACRGASNEYPQYMFSWKKKKNIYLSTFLSVAMKKQGS